MAFRRTKRVTRRFRSRRRNVKTMRKTFKRASRPRRGRRSSRAVNIRKAHTKMTREFLWGSLYLAQDGTTASPYIATPDNLGSQTASPLVKVSGSVATYALGNSQAFSLQDLPPGDVDLVRMFNFYKVDSVTLKFKPRWNNTGQDVSNAEGAMDGGGGGAPRLYMHTQRDAFKIANDTPTLDYILAYGDHTIYDLSKQRLYHIKPSTTQSAAFNQGGSYIGANATERPTFGKWFATSTGTTLATNEIQYLGLQYFIEWENPPLPTVVSATTTIGTQIDIFATYTISMKTLEV